MFAIDIHIYIHIYQYIYPHICDYPRYGPPGCGKTIMAQVCFLCFFVFVFYFEIFFLFCFLYTYCILNYWFRRLKGFPLTILIYNFSDLNFHLKLLKILFVSRRLLLKPALLSSVFEVQIFFLLSSAD